MAPGYRRLPCSDPEEQRLQDEWYAGEDGAGGRLAAYLWNRTKTEVEEDRRKHPKKKRNQTWNGGPTGEGRLLP